MSRRRRRMYCGHARLCVCLSVRGRTPTLLHGPGCNFWHGRGCPLVVHYWADLQSGHGLHCYGNITRTLVTSLCPSRDMTTYYERPGHWPSTGAFSTLLRRPGLRASSDGILPTKSEHKMLANSLYAWF